MKTLIADIRTKILGSPEITVKPDHCPEQFLFMGHDEASHAGYLADKIIPSQVVGADSIKKERTEIFSYITDFWQRSLFRAPFMAHTARGLNLAKRPFMAPNGTLVRYEFGFAEQYRWDTYFQNKGLVLAGGYKLAIHQLLNLVDVFDIYERIPNALTTAYLSHAQPPLEIFSAFDIVHAGVPVEEWFHKTIHIVERDLFIEWLDANTHKIHVRQTNDIIEKYGCLTRYTGLHFHPLLASCEDGKDHNWISLHYGTHYLPVQLNAIIYGIVTHLEEYYRNTQWGNSMEKAEVYQSLKNQIYADFQKMFWCDRGKWKGFRNYSLRTEDEGHILYGDLSAEIWPLFVGIATPEQAEVTKENLARFYKGDYGLAATSLILREGGSIEHISDDNNSYQWEYPNCWAPLMYIAVEGLKRYGYLKEAMEYEYNWVRAMEQEFKEVKGFSEKSPYSSGVILEPGFYGTVKGFGWTIAIYLEFLHDLALNNMIPE